MSPVISVVPPPPGHPRMEQLCARFPGLLGKPGTGPWEALELLRWLCEGGGSSGEKHAARFVLGVWNATTDWRQVARDNHIKHAPSAVRFDLFAAMAVWDRQHAAAAVSWLQEPFWP